MKDDLNSTAVISNPLLQRLRQCVLGTCLRISGVYSFNISFNKRHIQRMHEFTWPQLERPYEEFA